MNYINHNQNYYSLLKLAAEAISKAVMQDTLDKGIKDFMVWLLHNDKHMEDYLRMLGVAGSIELELKLFKPVIKEQILDQLKKYISLLNAYFAYETISDNLAVGMGKSISTSNPNYSYQKKIILDFNDIMIRKINGDKQNSIKLLEPLNEIISEISVNHQTLSPKQMQIFIDAYAINNKCNPKLLENSFMTILILNIATCQQLLDSLKNSLIYPILKHSLEARYSSISNIICQSDDVSRNKLTMWGRDSILTIPTYAYCIGAVEEISPSKKFHEVINNGLLYDAMSDGALLTRLLNDVGTRLLTLTKAEQNKLFNIINNKSRHKYNNIYEHLLYLAKHHDLRMQFTRIRKDLEHGEFNICLDNLNLDSDLEIEIKTFFENLKFYSRLYHKTYDSMLDKLKHLDDTLGNQHASKIIHNFVQFHEYKYSFNYETVTGDYAITNK